MSKKIKNTYQRELDEYSNRCKYETDRRGPAAAITRPEFINSSRLTIETSNIGHFVNLVNPEISNNPSGLENRLAEFASTLKKSDGDYEILEVFEKNKYNKYFLLYDEKRDFYHVEKYEGFEVYGEKCAIRIDNVLNDMEVGDKIKENEIIHKSSNFDENLNYRMGVNLNCCYLVDLYCQEDAYLVMNDADKKMTSYKGSEISVSFDSNTIFLNLNGTKSEYSAFPEIGEDIKNGILLATRRYENLIAIPSMNNKALRKIELTDSVKYANGKIVDIDIYTNKTIDKFKKTTANEEIIRIYKKLDTYYKNIYKALKPIIKDGEFGKNYSRDLSKLYKEAKDRIDASHLQTSQNGSSFGDTKIVFKIIEEAPGIDGTKYVGLCGNKGVTGKICTPEESWFMEDGRPIHFVLNLFSVVSRLNSYQHNILAINDIANICVSKIKNLKSLTDKYDEFFRFLKAIKAAEYKIVKKMIADYSSEDKKRFMSFIENKGIKVFQFAENGSNILDIERMYDIYEYRPQRIVYPDGTLSLYPVVTASEYFLKMKQDPEEKFAGRGRGTMNPITQTPSKSNDFKYGSAPYSNTAVQLGKFEHLVLLAMKYPEALAYMIAIHSTSPRAMKAMSKLHYQDLDRELLLEILESTEDIPSNVKIIDAHLLLVSTEIIREYLVDTNWGTDEPPHWIPYIPDKNNAQ